MPVDLHRPEIETLLERAVQEGWVRLVELGVEVRDGHGERPGRIELHYGALPDGARSAIAGRLDALEAELEREAEASAADV